jgi:hypothetical protein
VEVEPVTVSGPCHDGRSRQGAKAGDDAYEKCQQ